MKSGPPIVVLNPYEWLPGHGESSVAIRSLGLDWVVELTYDNNEQTALLKRELCFNGVCCLYKASFPGPSLIEVDCQIGDTLGMLVEYPESEAALAWRQHFGNDRIVKHYAMWLLAENLVIQVFAKGFVLAEPTVVQVL